MPRPTFLKLGPHIRPGQQRNPIDFFGHWVKGHGDRDQMCQTVSDCLSSNFPKWISSSYICATYFDLTYPVVQNICDKKIFKGHNVLQTSLVLTFTHHINKAFHFQPPFKRCALKDITAERVLQCIPRSRSQDTQKVIQALVKAYNYKVYMLNTEVYNASFSYLF